MFISKTSPAAVWICLGLPLFWIFPAVSAEEGANPSALTVARIFEKKEFEPAKWGPVYWLNDGLSYTTLETSQPAPSQSRGNAKAKAKDQAKDIVRYDLESGKREVLVAASDLIPSGRSKPMKIEGYAWTNDLRKLVVFTNAKRVWRQNTRGDYWLFDRDEKRLRKLGGDVKPASLMFATLSPDSGRIAYVFQNNLFVQNLADLTITQLTSSGSDTLINGTSDWVNEEEFQLRDGFRWSPDGKHIAYWQFDCSGVRAFHLTNNTGGLYPKITSYRYPKVGERNSACRVGVVASTGGDTRWFDTKADPREHYIPKMHWTQDSRHVVFQHLNRLQNTNQVMRGDARSGETSVLFTDRDDAWVEVLDQWHWIEGGRRFLWLSERDGWRHLYAVSCSNKSITLLTPGQFDILGIVRVDERRKCVYLLASPENPTQSYLYQVPLEGGQLRRVTPEDQPGSHGYELSRDCRWAFHAFSRFGQPPLVELISLPEHKPIRAIVDNAKLRLTLSQLKSCPSEFFRVDIGEGVELDAWCIKPPDFDPARRYPLLIHVYGEPAGQTVVDRWGGDTYLWHCLLAQRGYLVMSIDNRGTNAPRGREWRKCIYRRIGILASADQAAALRTILKERPYVDARSIGIWGWSGGGSMSLNAIFRYPDLYRTAMAVAFISNQRLYDTVYQERYMGLPAENKAGYKNGSPLTFAHQLKGNLLLVHGTGDDNCHYQSCEVLVNELIKHNKQFSMLAYPNRTHGIKEGANTQRHLYETLTHYLETHLPAGSAP